MMARAMLNTNADTIAAELAIAMSDQFETTLYYCFEKKECFRILTMKTL